MKRGPALGSLYRGAAAALLLLAASARADDGSSGVALPGLVAQPAGSVRALGAELDLDADTVTLRLRLQVPAAAAALVLRGPMFGWLGEGETYPDRHFPELRSRWNGAALTPLLSFEARSAGRDVTADVLALKLDPFLIAETPPLLDPPPAADDPAYKRLLAAKAVQPTDGQPWARWQARRLWRFQLPPGAGEFVLGYGARPRVGLVAVDQMDRAVPLARYCVSASGLKQKLALPDGTSGRVVLRAYAIAVGVDGQTGASPVLQVGLPNAVFCGADGRPVFGGGGAAEARADKSGVVHVLRLDPP